MKKPHAALVLKFFSIGLLLLLLLNYEKIQAQNQSSPLSVGIKAGLTNGYFVGNNQVEISDVRHGFNAGIVANYEVQSILDIGLELLYAKSGALKLNPGYLYSAENNVLSDKIVNCDITQNSLNIPLLVGATLPGIKGSFKPRVYLGIDYNLSFLSKSTNTYAGNGTDGAFFYQKYENLGDRLLKSDFGFLAGTGFSFTQGQFSYIFDIRYRMGLKNLNNTQSDYVNSEIHSHVISTMFGVAYHL